jgi:hypothetical protein
MPSAKRHPYVVAREANIVRVDFGREPDPPAPRFPGAGALRHCAGEHEPDSDLQGASVANVRLRRDRSSTPPALRSV